MDYSDLLRWQWVLCLSAFDKFLHESVKIGMLEILAGTRMPTKKYLGFRIGSEKLMAIIDEPHMKSHIFEQEIQDQHGYQSFMDPAKMTDALSLIWEESHKWQVLSQKLAMTESDVKVKLKNIVVRRNQIVHEGDCQAGVYRQDIYPEDVDNVREFVVNLANAVYDSIIHCR